jgi:hypothetical protein
MKTSLIVPAFTLLLLAAGPCQAIEFIKIVTPDEAKALGVTLTSRGNGDAGTLVTIDFALKGELKDFLRVQVEIDADNKCVFFATLDTTSPTPDTRTAHFSADGANLANSQFSVVVLDKTHTRVGYRFRVNDFIEVKK